MPGITNTKVIKFSAYTMQRFKQVQALLDRLDPQAEPQALVVPGSPTPEGGIIVFPGSFNPPTTAHLAMLKQARHFAYLHGHMKVYAAISKHIVDKEAVERPLLVDRIVLLDTVLRHHLRHTGIMLFNRGLYVEQAEAVRACSSYSPKVTELYFLIGFDKIVQILDPRYYEDRDAALRELFALAELLVVPRGAAGTAELTGLLDRPENRQFASHIHMLPLNTAYRDISSTRIREDLADHEQEVPPEVRRFIRQTHAYAPPVQLPDGSSIDCYGERVKAIEALLKHANAGK
jgi:nicotinamide-nucleotide adenylyltransferase